MDHKICPLPWNQLSIQQNGDFRLCCQCVHPPFGKLQHGDGTYMNVENSTIEEARNSSLHKRVRKQMLAGEKPPECKLCWDEEAVGFKSKRLHMIQEYGIDCVANTHEDGTIDSAPLEYLDLRFGNLCNLKCRSCGPSDSSLWYSDWIELNNHTEFSFYDGKRYKLEQVNNTWSLKNKDFEWYENNKFWDDFTQVLPKINRLYLTGGEPLVNKAQWKLLELCIELGYAKNIILEYNSNMTKLPTHAFDLWKEFKAVNIGCSIDAVGDLANYVRYPSDWESVAGLLYKFNDYPERNLVGKFSPTVSILNVIGMLELTDWLYFKRPRNIRPMPSYHLLHGPEFLNLTVLPQDTKQWIVNQYEEWYNGATWREPYRKHFAPILEFMLSQNNEHLLPRLKEHTTILDKSRNQDVRNYLPWLADILDKSS